MLLPHTEASWLSTGAIRQSGRLTSSTQLSTSPTDIAQLIILILSADSNCELTNTICYCRTSDRNIKSENL